MTNEQLYLAESVADYLENLEEDDAAWRILAEFRRSMVCKFSPIGEHKCSVETHYGWCCDTCLQTELEYLKREYNIGTVGSCCGHGKKQGFIQVRKVFAEKMKELGYKQIPIDESGNGENCFYPKTKLIYCDEAR